MALITGERIEGGTVKDADGRHVVSANPSNGIAGTLAASASTTSPALGAVLASIAAPPAGVYEVEATVVLTATAETALRNIRLRQNAIEVAVLPSLTGHIVKVRLGRVTVAGGNLDLQAIAAGVAGAVYNTVLTATRVG